jgi:ferric-dicitrate binding protein FerR (iron transport regulator)
VHWKLLERFLSDDCDAAERAHVEGWAAAAPRNQEILQILKTLVGRTDESPSALVEWERLRQAVEAEEKG